MWLEMEKERRREKERQIERNCPFSRKMEKSEKSPCYCRVLSYEETVTQQRVCISRDAETVLCPPIES